MAAMPGAKRRLRLVVDWTVDLLFDRDASELGQLGHPPGLDDAIAQDRLHERSAGGTPGNGGQSGALDRRGAGVSLSG
jgi:NADH dehydrogenase